jgi:hypothetical protein
LSARCAAPRRRAAPDCRHALPAAGRPRRRRQRPGQGRDCQQHRRAAEGVRLPRVVHQDWCARRRRRAANTTALHSSFCRQDARANVSRRTAGARAQTRTSTPMRAPCRPSSTARCSCWTTAARRVALAAHMRAAAAARRARVFCVAASLHAQPAASRRTALAAPTCSHACQCRVQRGSARALRARCTPRARPRAFSR